MNIVYDAHIFRWQSAGGVSRYFTELIEHLPVDWSPTLLGLNPSPTKLPEHPRLRTSTLSSVPPRRFTQPMKRAWWKMGILGAASLLHPTYYNLTGGLKYSDLKCPVVVTVYDFIGATYPELEINSEKTIRCQREAILAARHVVCISGFTEQDLLNRYPQLAGRTTVIHLGSSFPVCPDPQPHEIFEAPAFLCVGNRGTYKNGALLFRAFANASKSHPRIRLRLAGAPLSWEEKWQLHFLGITDRVDSTVYPDEIELAKLYRSSVALLYPSRHEGFGIPPLEAMACGTLAVTSNTTSLPEVVGDGGIMLDPADEEAWTECMLQIANQQVPRANLIANGKNRASLLTWKKSAERHVTVYREIGRIN